MVINKYITTKTIDNESQFYCYGPGGSPCIIQNVKCNICGYIFAIVYDLNNDCPYCELKIAKDRIAELEKKYDRINDITK